MFQSLEKLVSFKYVALAMLVLQNTFLILFMSASRTRKSSGAAEGEGGGGDLYASSTAVVSMEAVKLVSCMVVIAYESSGAAQGQAAGGGALGYVWGASGLKGLWAALVADVWRKPGEMLRLSVPSLLYTLQNNLLYFALSNLDAATFQVGYQLKILTTAVFSYFMLGRQLSAKQWLSLLVLTAGVSMTQLAATAPPSPTADSQRQGHGQGMNTTLGFVAVLLAAMTSGFSGVYFERILKTSPTSVWMRNVQMAGFSILIALGTVYMNAADRAIVQRHGFFHGYDATVVAVILLQSLGGLIVAVVVKYADNILKGFAASFSIVTSCILSAIFLDFRPTLMFVVGAVLVNVAMYIYATYPYVAPGGVAGAGAAGTGKGAAGGTSQVSTGGVRSRHGAGSGAPGGGPHALSYLTQAKGTAHAHTAGSGNPFLAKPLAAGSGSGVGGGYDKDAANSV